MGAGLKIAGVSHAYGNEPVLFDIDLEVAPGELVCLLGPSGCGKTTLLRLAAGLESLQKGAIHIAGRQVAGDGINLPPERRGIGMVFQDFALFPHLTVLGNVGFGLKHMKPEERHARSLEMLERVGMASYAESYPHVLSGGQQQRVALARALAPAPPLILLDEPFSGLDARLRDRLRDDALHVLKTSKVMAVMVTHDSEEAMFMADRIAVMNRGRIVQSADPETLYFQPKNAFVANFFGEVNRLEGKVGGGVVDTPVGLLLSEGFPEGCAVEVLVRPEGLLLQMSNEENRVGPVARVLAARMLGRSSLIHMAIERDGRSFHLHARVPGHFLPQDGDEVAVRVDRRMSYVFPLENGAAAESRDHGHGHDHGHDHEQDHRHEPSPRRAKDAAA